MYRLFSLILFLASISICANDEKLPSNKTPLNDLIWVGRPDQSMSCDTKSGIPITEPAKILGSVGIKIYSQKKIHDPNPRLEMCGVDKGVKNAFLIQKKDLPKALEKEFSEIPQIQR